MHKNYRRAIKQGHSSLRSRRANNAWRRSWVYYKKSFWSRLRAAERDGISNETYDTIPSRIRKSIAWEAS